VIATWSVPDRHVQTSLVPRTRFTIEHPIEAAAQANPIDCLADKAAWTPGIPRVD
jgi:hypothetical protein